MNDDTIKLLRECNSGVKMGIDSLDDVLEHVRDDKLKELLKNSRQTHEKLGDDTHRYLLEYGDEGKEPSAMAKLMSWVKTNFKVGGEDTDCVAADLIIDGCNMGVKSLYKYLYKYPAAKEEVKKLTKDIIEEEENLAKNLRPFLA